MTNTKLCAGTAGLAVVTTAVSFTAAPPDARAAQQSIPETESGDVAVLPAVAAAAAAGLLAAFALGVAQGYMERKNVQQKGATHAGQSLAELATMEFDYVLD
jgi:hypothetical protein